MNLQCSHFGPKVLWTMSSAAYACSLVPIPQMLSLTQSLQHVFRYVSGIHVVLYIFTLYYQSVLFHSPFLHCDALCS